MAIIGVWSSFGWLVGMTIVIAVLSQYVVATIEVYFIESLSFCVCFQEIMGFC